MSTMVRSSHRRRVPSPVLALALVLAMALVAVAPAPVAAQDQEAREPRATNHGWYAPPRLPSGVLPAARYSSFCDETGTQVWLQVRTRMWARGANANGFHFKVRLVPADSDGQLQLPYAWSDNQTFSFTPTTRLVTRWMSATTPAVDANADWDLEVKMKFTRHLRPAWRHKFRLDFTEPDCGGGISPS